MVQQGKQTQRHDIHTYLLFDFDSALAQRSYFEWKGDKSSSSAECRTRTLDIGDTKMPADWMPTHKPTEISGSKTLQLNSPSLWWVSILPTWLHCRLAFAPALRWRHNGHGCVSSHQPHHCLLDRLFRCRSQKTLKLRVTGLCAGNSPGTGEFPAQMASNAENVSIWWRHHGLWRHLGADCFTPD